MRPEGETLERYLSDMNDPNALGTERPGSDGDEREVLEPIETPIMTRIRDSLRVRLWDEALKRRVEGLTQNTWISDDRLSKATEAPQASQSPSEKVPTTTKFLRNRPLKRPFLFLFLLISGYLGIVCRKLDQRLLVLLRASTVQVTSLNILVLLYSWFYIDRRHLNSRSTSFQIKFRIALGFPLGILDGILMNNLTNTVVRHGATILPAALVCFVITYVYDGLLVLAEVFTFGMIEGFVIIVRAMFNCSFAIGDPVRLLQVGWATFDRSFEGEVSERWKQTRWAIFRLPLKNKLSEGLQLMRRAMLDRSFGTKVPEGLRRMRWTCECGESLCADFGNAEPQLVQELGDELMSANPYMLFNQEQRPSSRWFDVNIFSNLGEHKANNGALLVALAASSNEQNTIPSSSNPLQTGDIDASSSTSTDISSPSQNGQVSSSKSTGSVQSRNQFQAVTAQRLSNSFLELCVNSGDGLKSLDEICTTEIKSDGDLFQRVRTRYSELRGHRSRFFLLKPRYVHYVKVSRLLSSLVDLRSRAKLSFTIGGRIRSQFQNDGKLLLKQNEVITEATAKDR